MRFHLKLSWKLMLWACCALLLINGAAWAQDGVSGSDLGMGVVGTILASTAVPFLAALINQRKFSSTFKGWIAVGLSIIAAVGVTFATGGFAPQAFSGENFLVTAGAIIVFSQNIHRLFNKAFSDLEQRTQITPSAPAMSRSNTPPPAAQAAPVPSLEAMLRDALKKQEDANKQAAIVPAPAAAAPDSFSDDAARALQAQSVIEQEAQNGAG